jgi:allophanate hydrolase subunit 1
MDDEDDLWGLNEKLISEAAKEIDETGELSLNLYLQLEQAGIDPAQVTRRLEALWESEEEID